MAYVQRVKQQYLGNRNGKKKQLYGYFKWQTAEIAYRKTWTELRKGNFGKEAIYLLIASQNNVMLKQKPIIHNRIASVCYAEKEMKQLISKLAQKKFRTTRNRVGKVIHWELCKRSNFNHTPKWYIEKTESALGNEMHKICKDFLIKLTT